MPRRRPRLIQHIQTREWAPFTAFAGEPGKTYWHFKIRDSIVGDEPEFRYIPPERGCPFTVEELVSTAAEELSEARGFVQAVEFRNGIPVFSALFSADSRQVFCLWATDARRAA
jgi:hypothetical protein